jgi:environmental stress-induced protein Ves
VSRILGPETSRTFHWKNGLGTTLELASDAALPGGEWTWRLSIADVPAAAPFSDFPGVDRFLACLEGPGLRVERNGTFLVVPSEGEALAFAGEERVCAEPLGPGVRDVNLMLRRDRWSGSMTVARGTALATGAILVLIHAPAFSTPLRVETEGGACALTPGSTLVASGRVAISGTAVVCALASR